MHAANANRLVSIITRRGDDVITRRLPTDGVKEHLEICTSVGLRGRSTYWW